MRQLLFPVICLLSFVCLFTLFGFPADNECDWWLIVLTSKAVSVASGATAWWLAKRMRAIPVPGLTKPNE